MTKALTVLAECVDIRNGRRFHRGDDFAPVPTAEQAKRLIAAGCLPNEAEDLAEKADADAGKKAADDKSRRDKDAAAAQKLVTARTAKASAEQAVETAKADIAKAANADDKAAAEKALIDAEKEAKASSDELSKLAG